MLKLPSYSQVRTRVAENWQAALTVALISVPLSIALSIASGAGPLPGIIAGIWGTLIGSIFIGSNYNILGAAGALTTVLFGAVLAAPFGLGAAVLPLLALLVGIIIFAIWILKLERFLYYIPSSVMYGFAAGVAILIAIAQLFDATGLSHLKRTGHVTGDIEKFIVNISEVHTPSIIVFAVFLAGILIWKRYIKRIPAVIPAAILGITFGYLEATYFNLDLTSLFDKFGAISATLVLPVAWNAIPMIFADTDILIGLLKISGVIALIAVLETLITAKLGDRLTKTESSSSRELLGLALSNLGSGAMGGLPTTGVFIRTGANIKAKATHRTSGIMAALFTALIALIALPFFSYLPMAVIAAILVNTALGLLETERFVEYWNHELSSFVIASLVALITVFHDAGLGVAVGAILALLVFSSRVSRGRFDSIWNFADGTIEHQYRQKYLIVPATEKNISVVVYSIAGNLGYIDAARHLSNIKTLAHSDRVPSIIIRMRDLFSIDHEGKEAIDLALEECLSKNKRVFLSSLSPVLSEDLSSLPSVQVLQKNNRLVKKTSDALVLVRQ